MKRTENYTNDGTELFSISYTELDSREFRLKIKTLRRFIEEQAENYPNIYLDESVRRYLIEFSEFSPRKTYVSRRYVFDVGTPMWTSTLAYGQDNEITVVTYPHPRKIANEIRKEALTWVEKAFGYA